MLWTARRHQALDAEIGPLVKQAAPTLLELFGVSPETAGQLLTSAGDNPERMRSERAFAHLAGVAPIPASSGRTHRHRLNRGGDRAANNALHHRAGPDALRRTHPRLRRTPHQGRAVQEGHHELPQAIRRPRGLPRPGQHTGHAHHSKRPRSSCLTALGAS
nr:IS110 family transposase [Streptomyces montanus]